VKTSLRNRVLALTLVLAMLLPNLTGAMPAVQAETTQPVTYGEGHVYDIYDLTGSKTNTVKGTDETWDGQLFADVKEEHKENIVFKTKLTMGQQQVRLALNAKEGTSIFDPPGYAVYINHNGGAPYVAIKRNQQDLVVGSVSAVAGTWELEIGIVDILTDGVRTGKHVYVKKDGEVICEADDTNGYLTGDALGTKVIDFHYGAAIQMDTTYTHTVTYGTPNVYDIYDLTGSKTNTIKGTDETWDGQIFADVKEEHKENLVFKTKLTMGQQQVRLALNAKEGTSIFDPPGYAVYINHNGGAPYIAIKRNQQDLVVGSVTSVAGTYELEIGIVDILTDGVRTGKRVYVKKDGEVICEADDTNGYLTGDALGTKVIDFHYGAAIQMDTTYTDEYGVPTVYDIYDLTGKASNTVKGTDETWEGQLYADIEAKHKENMAFKTKLTMGAQQVRLSLNAKEGANIFDPPGYAVYLYGDTNRVEIRKNNRTLQDATVPGVAGTYIFEAGIVDILQNGNPVGKHLYVKMDDTVVCQYNDLDGYLTGDALGTQVIDFHYGAAIQMDTTKEPGTTEPETTEPETTEPESGKQYGAANIYDIYDLTGFETNTVTGTGNDNWSGVILGAVQEAHKENIAFKTELTMGAQEVRLSLNAKEGASVWDPPGYAVYLYGEGNAVDIRRNNTSLQAASVQGVAGTYILEVGIVDILENGNRVGKHLYVKMDDVIVCEYDDIDGYLTGDALGTKIVDFHYGAAIQMDTTKQIEPTEPDTTEPETTEPETVPQTVADGKVYDIHDLTGNYANTYYGAQAESLGIPGVADNWSDSVIGNVKAEDKENITFKTKLTVNKVRTDGPDTLRLSLGLTENATAMDFGGYSLRVTVDAADGKTYFGLYRNGAELAYWEEESVIGTYELEFSIQSILEEDKMVGKRLTLKRDGQVLKTCDDTNGFLTGDALGTKLAIFHYVDKVVMESTKPPVLKTYAEPTVYDIYDLTGKASNTVKGTDETWEGQLYADIKAKHKENMAFKTKLTMGAQQVRLSLNAKEGADIFDPPGYAIYLYGADNCVEIRRNNASLQAASVQGLAGTYVFEAGIVDILQEGNRVGKHIYVKINGAVVCEYDDMDGYLTGTALGTQIIDFHYGAAIKMDSTTHTEPTVPETTEPETGTQSVAKATRYDLYALMGVSEVTVAGQLQGVWGTTLGHVNEAHKANVAFASDMDVDEPQTIMLGLGLTDLSQAVQVNSGYVLEIVNKTGEGETDTVKLHRAGAQIFIQNTDADFHGKHALEFGMVDLLSDNKVIGKRLYVKLDGAEVFHYDDKTEFLTAKQLGTKIDIYASGNDLVLGSSRNLAAGQANVYDLYDMKGAEQLTVMGRATDPDNWGTTLGHILSEHKENMAFRTTVTMEEAQTVMLGLGLTDLSQAVQLNSGYVLEIVMKTGKNEVDTVKIHRAGEQIYCKDQTVDFNGEYELEFGVVDLYDLDAKNAVVGKRIYLKVNGEEVLHYDDTVNALSGDALGTKVDVYVSGKNLKMTSIRGYQASNAVVYDLYDLSFRQTLEVSHSDDNGNVNWGVLIGNVDEAHKGNVALKTKVTMSRDQQQNLLIGLGLKGHWPVSGGFGYQIELIADPENKTDSLRIYKNINPEGGEPVGCYNAEQSFDFNGTFELEVGVTDLLDSDKKVVARRIYVKVDGRELMHFDDTKNVVSGADMGTVVAAYVSSGTAILGTCVTGIPTPNVMVYDIYDLLGRAGVRLNRTDAGGAVVWTNVLGQVTATNDLNYALRVDMDTSQVDRSSLQELILGLCKDTDLFDSMGYRLSLYFGTDGTTSLVLRDSATDQVLASASGVYPGKYELEFGITDFFDSNMERIGKKIYLKIDGKEELSYLDKEINRVRGNLLCAYTTSPVTMTTKYGYVTVPVTYVVNGETAESSEYITSNTDVIPGKKSMIDVALGNKDEFTSVLMKQVLLNGQPITPISDKQDVYVFELKNPSKDDALTVEIEVHTLTVDEAQVYDLYEITGKKEIVIPANSVDQIGTLFADGQEGVLNRAIRFAYYIPKTGGGLRLGYGSDTSDIWSRTGTHIEIWCGFATISHGFHVSALSSGNTDIFKADSWSVVEVGIVKCYEDGVYKYDRWYVKAGETAEKMELITYFDSTQRHDSTLNIMARTPDTGDDFKLTSTLEVRSVTDISETEDKEHATVAFKPLFLKGESVKLVVFPVEGKTLESLTVNSETVKAALTSDGGYVYTLENAQQDVAFSYTVSDDESLYNITADSADHLQIIPDQTSVAAGGAVTVQIKMDGGYVLKSLTVNGADFLPMARYDKTALTYTLTLSGIREDKHIQAQAEKVLQDGPVADGATEEKENTNLPTIIAVAVLCVAALGGAVAVVATRAKKKGRKQ